MSKKVVYVPRNWKVSYVDAIGNEHENVELRANAEYLIVEDGNTYHATLAGVRTEGDKTFILAKVFLNAGYMTVMNKVENHLFDLNKVTEITRISTIYAKSTRSIRDHKNVNEAETFTFVFDSEKYASQYRITIIAGEFVALALKDPVDPNKKCRSIYGHIADVDSRNNEIKFVEYVCNRGVRDVVEKTIDLNTLLGIYRYELQFGEYAEKKKPVTEEATEATEVTEN